MKRDRKKYRSEHYYKNKERITLMEKMRHQEYIDRWLAEILIPKYGECPSCQICGRETQWRGGATYAPNFDHRNGYKGLIKTKPMTFIGARPPSEKNVQTFLSENFGVLCSWCNKKLPASTEMRKKIYEYLKEEFDE